MGRFAETRFLVKHIDSQIYREIKKLPKRFSKKEILVILAQIQNKSGLWRIHLQPAIFLHHSCTTAITSSASVRRFLQISVTATSLQTLDGSGRVFLC